MEHLFVDGLGSLSVNAGVVRMEMCVQTKVPNRDKNADKKQDTALVPACSINMPVQSFANMAVQFQGLVDKMEKDGLLKKQSPAQSGSPNFN